MKKLATIFAALALAIAPVSFARASISMQPQTEELAPSHGKGTHGEGAEEEEGPPGKVNWFDTQLVNNKQPSYALLLVNFAILLFIYYRFGKQPIAQALKARRDGIGKQIENAAQILKEAKSRSRKYRAQLDKVGDDAEKARQTNIDAGKGKADQIVRDADEKAARIKREAEFLLEQEGKQTKIDLLRETVEKAAHEAEAMLKKSVTPEDQERLAQAFIDQLDRDYKAGSLGGAA